MNEVGVAEPDPDPGFLDMKKNFLNKYKLSIGAKQMANKACNFF